jgi:predicted dehydrogenase
MVGGGHGAFIGDVHRIALRIDGLYDLVCGAFSSDPERSKASGAALGLDPARAYPDYETMIRAEAALPEHERMQIVSIVTPNHMHFGPAKAAMEAGFDVVCDKPVTRTLDEAIELREVVRRTGRLFALTHTYLGYPLVEQARRLVAEDAIGTVRRVVVEYPQGWLAKFEEGSGSKQAGWRTDPARSGEAGGYGDIGTHAHNLAEYVTGQKVVELLTELNIFVPGRKLDDDGASLLRFDGGARGVLIASQICAGEENALRLRVYGETGGLEWAQEEPNTLWLKPLDGPAQRWRAGGNIGYLAPDVRAQFRTPMGHPEGYLEAFATIYRRFAAALAARAAGQKGEAPHDIPGIEEGVRGMAFVAAAVRSSREGGTWVRVDG